MTENEIGKVVVDAAIAIHTKTAKRPFGPKSIFFLSVLRCSA